MEATKKITIMSVIPEGIQIGLKNALSLLGAVILYILTIWIPFINVGTTIAMASLPVALSKGTVISPTFIFDAKYRKYMGEFFTLIGLMSIAVLPALLFLIVPGIVISIGWSLAIYILLDKEVAPGEAMLQSNKATYGYKWTIFGVSFILMLVVSALSFIFGLFGESIGIIFSVIISLLFSVITIGCNTVIYKKLVLNNEGDEDAVITDTKADVEEVIVEEEKKD